MVVDFRPTEYNYFAVPGPITFKLYERDDMYEKRVDCEKSTNEQVSVCVFVEA